MVQGNEKRFNELLAEMKLLFEDTTTYVRIVITEGGKTVLTETFRHPERLKKSNRLVTNIKGGIITPYNS